MIRAAGLLLAALLAAAPLTGLRADDPAAAIGAVIDDQIRAFQREDLEAAWQHAAPGIQAMFRTPETFGRMVRRGYPMIWRPSRWDLGALVAEGDGFVQTVLFQDARGALFEADYEMTLVDGVWRIAGVTLRRLPGVAS